MVSVLGLVGLGVILAVNTAVAAVGTRLLRVRLTTMWGTALYVAVAVPLALTVTTILLGSVAGPDLGSRSAVVGLLVGVPFVLGVSFDVLWMPAPDEVDLPDTVGE